MNRRSPFAIAILAGLGVMSPVAAQVSPFVAVAPTNATTRIMQPAMITASQDLMFAISTPVAVSLTTIGAPRVTAPTTAATATPGSANSAPRSAPNGAALLQSATSSLSTLVPTPARASFVVAGDAGQSISVTVPGAIDLAREGGIETAVLTTTDSLGDGPQFLGGNFAQGGTLSFNVGGQVTLAGNNVVAGTYNGVLAVIAQYN